MSALLLPLLGVHFAWLGDTELLARGMAETELRATEHDDLGKTRIRDTFVRLGARFAATDCLELAFGAEVASTSAVGLEQDFALRGYAGSVRYRFVPRTSPIVPLTRLTVVRDGVRRDVIHAELDGTLLGTYGRFVGGGQLSYVIDANRGGGFRQKLRVTVAAAVEVTDEFAAGLELHDERDRDSGTADWTVAGPSVSWTRGRFWLAGHYGFGVSGINRVTSVAWAIAF